MTETAKEQSLNPETIATLEVTETRTSFNELDENVKLAISCASDKKAFNIAALDLRDIASFTEFFVITSGSNQRQVQAISDEINEQLKKQLSSKPVRVEGYNAAEWILMDYVDVVVHVFKKDKRGFYSLEDLWGDAKLVNLSAIQV